MKTYASFYDIVTAVKQETGISNLTNRYNEIISMIVRAERDINPYAGHFIRKRMRYRKGKGCFNGKTIKYPQDYIQTIGIFDGNSEGKHPLQAVSMEYHLALCNGLVNENVVFHYWASQMNPEGHPLVPYTHFEAVVAFIVWKLYSQRAFQDKGAQNAKREYMDFYERACKAARGFDFFPTQENMNNMKASMLTPRRYDVICDDGDFSACCIEEYCGPCNTSNMEIWYWQEDSLEQVITHGMVDSEFLSDKEKIDMNAFQLGMYFSSSYVGRYGLAIKNGPVSPDGIVDTLGLNIWDSVNFTYDPDQKLLVIISKNYITPGSFFLKLT